MNAAMNGRRLCDRYTLLERLGAGGQGEVWRAIDETTGTEIALKVLNPALARSTDAWAALEREHALVAQLDHPSILRIGAPVRTAGGAVLPMELAAGGDLRRLRGAGYLQIVPVLLELAQALAHAHERGIVHGDLKPGNVLFDEHGRVRLADFGVAAAVASPPREAARSELSPFTASPEQLRGEPAAIGDDIYGLGALAYELLSGYPPYYPRFSLKRVLEEAVPELKPVHQAPPRLIALVMVMLAKRAHLRPQSMREVIDELDTTLNDTLTFDFDEMPEAQPEPTPCDTPLDSAAAMEPKPESRPESRPESEAQREVPPEFQSEDRSEDRFEAQPEVRLEHERNAEAWNRAVAPPPWREFPIQPAGPGLEPGAAEAPLRAERMSARGAAPRPAGQTRRLDRTASRREPRREPPELRATPAWEDLQIEAVPHAARLPPRSRSRRWPWVALLLLVACAAGAYYILPRVAPRLASLQLPSLQLPSFPALRLRSSSTSQAAPSSVTTVPPNPVDAATSSTADSTAAADVRKARASFEQALAALAARGAEIWGGSSYAAAKSNAADAASALAAGHPRLARAQLTQALQQLDSVRDAAPQALAAQLARGDQAFATGHAVAARQAYRLALRIDPSSARGKASLRRAERLVRRQSMTARTHATDGDDPAGQRMPAAADSPPAPARNARNAQARPGAERTPAPARTVRSGQAGEAAARTRLSRRLQQLIDDPRQLASADMRGEALSVLHQAQLQAPYSAVLRAQIARLRELLPGFDKPVRLALKSDNATQVAIPSVGSFGTFSRREIELKPGRYTVIGTRAGYRDVHRVVTVAPGDNGETIVVRCIEPI